MKNLKISLAFAFLIGAVGGGCGESEIGAESNAVEIYAPANLRSITRDSSVDLIVDLPQAYNVYGAAGIEIFIAEGDRTAETGVLPNGDPEKILDGDGRPIFDYDPDDDAYLTPFASYSYTGLAEIGIYPPAPGITLPIGALTNGTTYTFAAAVVSEDGRRSTLSNIITDTPCLASAVTEATVGFNSYILYDGSVSEPTVAPGDGLDIEGLSVVACGYPWEACEADLRLYVGNYGSLFISGVESAGTISVGGGADLASISKAPEFGYQSTIEIPGYSQVTIFVRTRTGKYGRLDIEQYDALSGVVRFSMRIQNSTTDPRQL